MTHKTTEMIDMVFDLDGGTLPAGYPFALWAELVRCIPQLEDEKSVGILPLRGTRQGEELLLPKRAKLVIRLPTTLLDPAARLAGQQLDVGGRTVRLGAAKSRPISPHPTVHAQLVTGASDEIIFVQYITTQLAAMRIKGKLICGRRGAINDAQQSIDGFSLVVHDLTPEASLQLQFAGLGKGRQFGCGIFVPSKVISGLSEG